MLSGLTSWVSEADLWEANIFGLREQVQQQGIDALRQMILMGANTVQAKGIWEEEEQAR